MRTHKQLGFTLVELSMVLAILGLLVGTVFGAQAMLNSQRLRAVGADATKHLIAMNQFKLKYNYFAGDFPTATSLWGRADGGVPVTSNCASPTSNASSANSKATCNGDGNGGISSGYEPFRAWQHLSAAEYIVGTYTGIRAGMPNTVSIGINTPKGEYEQSGYGWLYSPLLVLESGVAASRLYSGDYSNGLGFGKANNSNLSPYAGVSGSVLSAQQQFELDTKLDDGLPAVGHIRAVYPTGPNPNCTVGTTSSAVYNVSFEGVACSVIFLQSFVNTSNR